MKPENERVDAYLDTIQRMEPDIAMVDRDAALASIAISLKRIADAMDPLAEQIARNDARETDRLAIITRMISSGSFRGASSR